MGLFFIFSMKAAICLIAFYLIYKLMLSRETFHAFNRVAILGIIILSLIIPWLKITVSNPSEVNHGFANMESLIISGTVVGDDAEQSMTIAQCLIIIYIIGVIFFLSREVISIIKLRMLISRGKTHNYLEGLKLVVMKEDIAPFSWFRYIVISEDDYRNNRQEIITHELAHIARHHSIDIALCNLLIIMQWFNPAIWLLKIELQNLHEYEADEAVINQGIDARHYQMLLIRKTVGERLFTMANNLNHNSLKKRITMMTIKKSNPWMRAKYLFVVPVAAIAITAFANPKVENITNQVVAESEQMTNEAKQMISNTTEAKETAGTAPEVQETDAVRETIADTLYFVNGSRCLSMTDLNRTTTPNTITSIRVVNVKTDAECKKYGAKKGDIVMNITTSKKGTVTTKDSVRTMTMTSGNTGEDNALAVAEDMPSFPGGPKAMFDYISKNMEYPANAKMSKIQGRVFISFIVRSDGSISDAKVIRSADPLLDKEGLRIINGMPKWTPGHQNGKAVNVRYVIPITFKLA
jgi:TonB family protein